MKHVICVPYAYEDYFPEFHATTRFAEREDVLAVYVDNTIINRGIMRSHNIGLARAREVGAEWLTVASAAIRFGQRGGIDWFEALDARPDDHVVEAAGVNGWHLIAFKMDLLDYVGTWDENFTPYGFDDIDMSLRIQRARGMDGRIEQVWEKVYVDVTDMGMAHSIHLGGVSLPPEKIDAQIAYFRRKWGRHPGESDVLAFDSPFGDPANRVSYWPPVVAS